MIIHNIPESADDAVARKRAHDLEKVGDITKAICGSNSDVKVERVACLLRRDVSPPDAQKQPRLLLVRLERKEHADLLLKMRFSLREAGFANVYINKDLPREEREKERQLRQELKEKGKDTHMIFRGKVVPRNE